MKARTVIKTAAFKSFTYLSRQLGQLAENRHVWLAYFICYVAIGATTI